jgi:hypothetical protein
MPTARPLPFAGGFNESCHRVVIRFASSGVVADLKRFDRDANVIGLPNTGENLSVCQRDTDLAKQTADWLSKPLSVLQ